MAHTVSARRGGGGGRQKPARVVNADVPERLVQRQEGWKSSTCKNMYVEDSLKDMLSVSHAILHQWLSGQLSLSS